MSRNTGKGSVAAAGTAQEQPGGQAGRGENQEVQRPAPGTLGQCRDLAVPLPRSFGLVLASGHW